MPDNLKYDQLGGSDFLNACRVYAFLMDRHFPEKGALKLVGDRYRLSGDQRTVLYRGISSRQRSEIRKSLLVSDITGRNLVIDGYNVLFTLLNYRLGRITFISTDSMLRDAGSLHGKLRDENTFGDCVQILVNYLIRHPPAAVEIYLDSPVSHSERHAQLIRDKLKAGGLTGDCQVIKSADWALKNSRQSVIATSDTAIIEKALVPVFDLSRHVLDSFYKPDFPVLDRLIADQSDMRHHIT